MESPDRTAIRWTRRIVAVALVLVAAALIRDLLFGEPSGDSAATVAFAVAVLVLIVVVTGGLVEAVFRFVTPRARPVVLGATILPALGVVGSLGLPESLIHYSGHEAWAYLAAHEVSVVPPFVAGAMAAGLAFAYRLHPVAPAAVAVLAFLLAAAGRDLVLREQDPPPSWCGLEWIDIEEGGDSWSGGGGGRCTMLLPERDPFEEAGPLS